MIPSKQRVCSPGTQLKTHTHTHTHTHTLYNGKQTQTAPINQSKRTKKTNSRGSQSSPGRGTAPLPHPGQLNHPQDRLQHTPAIPTNPCTAPNSAQWRRTGRGNAGERKRRKHPRRTFCRTTGPTESGASPGVPSSGNSFNGFCAQSKTLPIVAFVSAANTLPLCCPGSGTEFTSMR